MSRCSCIVIALIASAALGLSFYALSYVAIKKLTCATLSLSLSCFRYADHLFRFCTPSLFIYFRK